MFQRGGSILVFHTLPSFQEDSRVNASGPQHVSMPGMCEKARCSLVLRYRWKGQGCNLPWQGGHRRTLHTAIDREQRSMAMEQCDVGGVMEFNFDHV